MRIAIGQFPIVWEDSEANMKAWSERFTQIELVDLIILPEMFTTGFSMDVGVISQPMNGPTVSWMKAQSTALNTTIMGSFICSENGNTYNRLAIAKPDATVAWYDKRHLFSFAEEDKYFKAGTERLIVDLDGWKVCPMVCYDLRFPVWARNTNNPKTQYDVLVYVANWPAVRTSAWQCLLQARAHENQAFVIGANRLGEDGKGIKYSGDSLAIGPKGETLAKGESYQEGWVYADLNKADLLDYRDKFRALNDADKFELKD
jgi:omega-amidase